MKLKSGLIALYDISPGNETLGNRPIPTTSETARMAELYRLSFALSAWY